jgi:transcription antitermination factor NusG
VRIPQWFAVHTSSRHEKHVALQLGARDIDYLLPLYDEVHRWNDRRMKVQLPLFPGYLFVRIIPTQRIDVVTVPGVARIVGFHNGPAPIDESEIEALRRGISSGMKLAPHPYLKAGCRVRIRDGALRGLEGVLVRNKNCDRIIISVDLIMKSIALEIDSVDLEVLS